MTDNEIIKAVECCIKNNCDLCPFCEMDIYSCENELLAKLMSIINRQQAEIERLTSNVFGMEYETAMYKAISESARAEAIKDFADRFDDVLAEMRDEYAYFGGQEYSLVCEVVHYKLLKTVKEWIKDYGT